MLIAVYFFIIKVALPQLVAVASALVEPVMVIVITLAGITLLFGAVGMRISNNLASTVVGGIFRAIGYLGRTAIHALGWVVRNTVGIIPRVFRGSRRLYVQIGINPVGSSLLAVLNVVLILAIII